MSVRRHAPRTPRKARPAPRDALTLREWLQLLTKVVTDCASRDAVKFEAVTVIGVPAVRLSVAEVS